MFPEEKRKWKSYCESLAADGLGCTEHKEEIASDTVEAIYELFTTVTELLEGRAEDNYRTKLAEISPEWTGKLNYLLQYCAEV